MLKPLDNDADGVEKRHLGVRQVNFLHKCHQPLQSRRRIRQEVVCMKLPLISDILETATCGDSDHLIVERVTCVEQVLKDLIYDRLLLLRNLDSNPLRDDDGDAAADDVEAGLLLASLRDKSVFEESVKVELIV